MVRLLHQVMCEPGPEGRESAVWSRRVRGKGTVWSRLMSLYKWDRLVLLYSLHGER